MRTGKFARARLWIGDDLADGGFVDLTDTGTAEGDAAAPTRVAA